jgi:hypothetical protein
MSAGAVSWAQDGPADAPGTANLERTREITGALLAHFDAAGDPR